MTEKTTDEMLAELDAFVAGQPAPEPVAQRDDGDDASTSYVGRLQDVETAAMLAELDAFVAQAKKLTLIFSGAPECRAAA